jgi:WD40 repeat protein
MSECPAREQLALLLAEQLSAPEADRLTVHVQDCADCQQLLQELSSLSLTKPALTHGNDSWTPPLEPRPEFLLRLREVGVAGDTPVPGTNASPTPHLGGTSSDPGNADAWPQVAGYEILSELGRGGMGVVYRARQLRLGRLVALKVLLAGAHAGEQELTRFRAEAEAVAQLQHPNIVQIYEVGEEQGRPYLALEYIDGGSLEEKVRGAPLPAPEVARLIETLAVAVHAAHQRGIVHRDLKPANVLLTADGIPKITDFGLAKRLDGVTLHTQTGAIVGTPNFMAPEQTEGKGVGPLADVHALGAILYDLLTGRPPFVAETPLDTLLRVRDEEPVPPSLLRPRLPRDLETICLKCLGKEPRQRYASALALAEDLQRFLRGEPIRARPVGSVERAWKWCRRHPAGAALIAMALIGFVLVTWKWREAVLAIDAAAQAVRAQTEAELREQQQQRDAQAARDKLVLADRTDYCATVWSAEQKWLAGDVGGAIRAFDSCREDLRGWEWHYGQRRLHDDLFTLRTGRAALNCVAISPDGTRLAAGTGTVLGPGEKGEVRIWDTATYRDPIVLRGHDGAVTTVAFLPDCKHLVSASITADFWRVMAGDLHAVGEVILWDLDQRKRESTFPGYGSVAVSRDGSLIALPGPKGTVVVRDLAEKKEVLTLPPLPGILKSVALSPDGHRVAAGWTAMPAAGRMESSVRVWDVNQKKELVAVHREQVEVDQLTFSPDGSRFALASSGDHPLTIWDATTGALQLILRGHTTTALAVAFSPDGTRLASGGKDESVRVWDAANGDELIAFRGHTSGVQSLAFRPATPDAGLRLVSAGEDGTIKVWDAETPPGPLVLRGHQQTIFDVQFGRGELLATGGGDGARVWDLAARKQVFAFACRAEKVAFSADGVFLATVGGDASQQDKPGELRIWDLRTGQEHRSLTDHTKAVLAVAFSADGKHLATTSGSLMHDPPEAGEVLVWDTDWATPPLTLHPSLGVVFRLAFSPDSQRLALTGMGGTVQVCEAASGKEVLTLRGHKGWVESVAFSPDGTRLATGDAEGIILVRDATTGEQLLTLRAHTGGVLALAYSPDGQRLVSASYDPIRGRGEVRLWDSVVGREVLALPGWYAVAWSADGRRLAAPGDGGLAAARQVQVWDATPWKASPTSSGRGSP